MAFVPPNIAASSSGNGPPMLIPSIHGRDSLLPSLAHQQALNISPLPLLSSSTNEPMTRLSLRDVLGVTSLQSPLKVSTNVQIIGHRGSLFEELENTMESFRAALKAGCHGVELDVFMLKCGTIVVFHGGDPVHDELPGALDNYCNMPQTSILDFTYDQLEGMRKEGKLLQFSTSFQEFPCPIASIERGRIPKLEELLEEFKQQEHNPVLKIELKDKDMALPVIQLVEKHDMVHQCHYSSFLHEEIAELRKLRPRQDLYPTGALFEEVVPENYLEQAKAVGATEVHLRYDTCTTQRIQEIHNAGMKCMAWFRGPTGMNQDALRFEELKEQEDSCVYETLMETGVDALCVNKPSQAVMALSSKLLSQ